MSTRVLYLAAYDIACPSRLRTALRILKGYASGRQKSVFECFLSPGERRALLAEMREVIDATQDRFLLLRLEPRGKFRVLGIAVKPIDPPWFYIG